MTPEAHVLPRYQAPKDAFAIRRAPGGQRASFQTKTYAEYFHDGEGRVESKSWIIEFEQNFEGLHYHAT